MPKVKLTIREEPVEVPDDEVESLRGMGLLEAVLDEPAGDPAPKPPSPARVAGISTPADDAGKTEETP